ncbi:hypothetical protein ONJ87_26815, partial [Salmonella enterica subsp. enterica serovar Anatum]|nr:hypothetical protein [Salmonella enterica subsp. enterica serovar Anatum]
GGLWFEYLPELPAVGGGRPKMLRWPLRFVIGSSDTQRSLLGRALIHAEKLEKARSLLISTTLAINEISQMCGYPSLQYFYSVFK